MEFKLDYIVDDIKDFIENFLKVPHDEPLEHLQVEFIKRKKLSNTILNLHASDQAIVFSKLKDSEKESFIHEFGNILHEDVILFLEENLLYNFLDFIGFEKFCYFVAMLEFNETVEVLEKFSEEKRSEIMKNLPFKKRIQLKRSLSYPEYSCGRNMSVDYLSVPYWWTVARTKKYIKDSKKAIENEDGIIFVTDEERHLIGSISVIKLLNEDTADTINACYDAKVISVKVFDSIPDISHLFDQYDLDVIPVVNKGENIVGVLQLAEIIEYLQESSDKQALRRAGVFEAKTNTLFGITYARFIWLFINLLTAVFASYFISLFEDSIAKVTALAVLMPITASMGGNCGMQTSTVIIRSLFSGTVTRKQIFTEITIAILNGIILSVICGIGIWLFYGKILLGLVFAFALLITMFVAGVVGVLVPLMLKKLKIDPAVASSVFLTTATDVVGFLTLLFLGTVFLVR